jgi:hypothetical protein
MTVRSERISPLREGSTGRNFVASAVPGPLFSGHPIPALSQSGSLSMVQVLPPSTPLTSAAPSWAAKVALTNFRLLCTMLQARMVGEPVEYERRLRLDGDSESLWAVEVEPRTRKRSGRRSK